MCDPLFSGESSQVFSPERQKTPGTPKGSVPCFIFSPAQKRPGKSRGAHKSQNAQFKLVYLISSLRLAGLTSTFLGMVRVRIPSL